MATPLRARDPFEVESLPKNVESHLRLVPKAPLPIPLPEGRGPELRSPFLETIWRNAWIYNEPVGSWQRAFGAVVGLVLLPPFLLLAFAPLVLFMIPLGLMLIPILILAFLSGALGGRRGV